MAEETEYVGGRPDPSPNSLKRLLFPGVVLGIVALLAAGALVFREPLIGFARSGLDIAAVDSSAGEPATTRAFVAATVAGDGPKMHQYVTDACVNDSNATLCLGAPGDYANWRAYVKAHRMRAVYIGRSGAYVFYLLYIYNPKTSVEHDYALTLHLNGQGLIDAQLGNQF